MKIFSDLNYADPSEPKNRLDLYLPENVISGPLIVYVHGGNNQ
jgi:acetyl esterase/lipase